MQSFTDIPDTQYLSASIAPLMDDLKSVMSGFSGTAFPTTNLQIGMRCYRTDTHKEYRLKSTGPSVWVLTADLDKVLLNYEDAETNYIRKDSNLSTLTDTAAARGNLGLGSAAVENVVPIAKGGTGATTASLARTALGLGDASTENVVPISKGGTGSTNAAAARTALGLGTAAVESVVPLAKGGTGATDAAGARTALALGAVAQDNVVPVVRGGTGATDATTARANLGIVPFPGPPTKTLYLTAGSYTWTRPTNCKWIKVIVKGGGGGSGSRGGGAGAEGGAAIRWLDVSAISSVTVTVGVGGTGGLFPGSGGSSGNGTTGGTSSFGTYGSATGGTGGVTGDIDYGAGFGQGGTAGVGSSGDINLRGADGDDAVGNSVRASHPTFSRGGGSFMVAPTPSGTAGQLGAGAGSGATSGLDGGPGCVIIEEYYA